MGVDHVCGYSLSHEIHLVKLNCTGYYSYLYAKCFAATIWEKICQEDPLSLATGSALRMKFLQHGGAKDATNILNDLVGNGITRPSGKGVIPDFTSLCNMFELSKW